MPASLPEPCPICNLPKSRSAEDVMPTWARNLLWGHLRRDEWELPPRVKLRVCVDCNSQMARVYEDTASPILKLMATGATVAALSMKDQALVGRWSIKTVMLLHLMHAASLGRSQEVDRVALHSMNQGGPPPAGSSVRLGKYVETDGSEAGAPLRGALTGAQSLTSTSYGVLGQLAIEVVSAEPEASFGFLRRADDDRFVKVWPPSNRAVQFPPPRAVTTSDLDAIRAQVSQITPGNDRYTRTSAARRRNQANGSLA